MSADPGADRVPATPPSKAAFAASVGTSFRLDVGPGTTELLLAELREGATDRGQESFALLFRGPAGPLVEQGTYAVAHTVLGAFDLFIVPVGQNAERTDYEAVFNRPPTSDASEGR